MAALRGHRVTLYEKESELGGLLPLAAMIKGTEIEDLPQINRYLARQSTERRRQDLLRDRRDGLPDRA